MDDIKWFKFNPSRWMMGKIQRCPEITQARFIRLCSLYWSKDCEMTIEDAIIEIDQDHFDILKSKKIITIDSLKVYISFLDEQIFEIKEDKKDKSQSGIVGNLKRWHKDIYEEFLSKKISLEKAIELSKIIAKQSHTDNQPIASQSQNIADKDLDLDKTKIRKDEEEIRKDILLKKESKEIKFNFKKKLVEYGFNEKLVDDWLAVRKTKKATNTETAFDSFIREIESRESNINEMLQICVTNSWSGFKYKWVDNLNNTQNGKSNTSGNDPQAANEQHKQSAITAVNAMFGIK